MKSALFKQTSLDLQGVCQEKEEEKMTHAAEQHDQARVLNEKIKGIKVAMLTTVDESNGILRSRPMVTQDVEFDGDLWFFTQASAPKVGEADQKQVNLSYVSPEENHYISVSGMAQLVRDRQKIEELWKPTHTIWFAGGKDDPDLALLKVTVTNAEYWDVPSNKMIEIFQTARSLATSEPTMVEHEKLQLK